MKKFIKKLFIIIGISLLTILGLGTAAYYLYFDAKIEQYLTQKVERELEKQFKREVSIERIQLNFPNPQVIISNIAIAREDKLSEGTLLSAKMLKARVLLKSLVSKNIILDDIVLDSPTIWIEFDEQGRSNLPSFGGKKKEETTKSPSRFHPEKLVERLYFPHVQIIDAQIYFAHKQLALNIAVKRLNTTLSLALQDLHGQGNISLEGGEFEYQDRGKIAASFSGDLEFKNRSLILSSFRVKAGSSEITASGTLANISRPHLDLSVSVHLSLDELDRFAEINQNLTGMVDFKGTVKGPVSNITARGHLDCPKGTAWKLAFKNVSTDVQYQENNISLTDLEIGLFDGNVSGKGELSLAGIPAYAAALTLNNVNIEHVNTLISQELQIAGNLSADLKVRADSFDFEDLILQTSLDVQNIYAYGVDVPRATAQIGIQDSTLSIKELDAEVFQGNVKGNGSLVLHSNFLYQAELDVENVELDTIMRLIPEPPDVSGQVRGKILAQGTDFDLEHLTLDADLSVLNLDAYDIKAKTLQALAHIKDNALSIEQLSTQLFGGTVQGAGKLVLAGEALPKFDTEFSLNNISVQAIMQQFAVRGQEQGIGIQGDISGKVAFKGNSFDLKDIYGDVNLDGTGNIRIAVSQNDTQEHKEITLPLELALDASLRESLVSIATLHVDSHTLQLTTSGTINVSLLEFMLEYQVASKDLQTLMKQILAFVPGMEEDSPLRQFAGNIEQLRGTVQGPVDQLKIQAEGHFTDTDFVWIMADEMTADVTYQGSTLLINRFLASYNSAHIEARGTIELANPSAPQLDIPVTLQSGKLDDYLAMFKQDLPVAGVLENQINTTIRGPVSNLHAALSLNITDGTAWEQSFDKLSGEIELKDNRIVITSLTLKKNGGNITAKGFFDFDLSFQAALAATNINFRDIDASKDIAVQYHGKMDVTLEVEGTLSSPSGKADILFKDLNYDGRSIDDVTCAVVMKHQTIQATLVTFRKKFSASFQLSLTPELSYRAEVLMKRAAVEQILSLAVDSEGISGIISGKINSEGSLQDIQQLSAEVKLGELDLDIFGQKIKNDKEIDLVVTQQKLTVKSLEMSGEELGLFAQGFLDFRGNFDLDLDGILDLRPVQAFLPKTIGITSLAGKVQLICNVRGTFQEPVIEGIAEIHQGSVQVATYPDPATDINGKLAFTRGKIEIPRLGGKLSKGTFITYGAFHYAGITPKDFSIDVEGKNIVIQDILPSFSPLKLTVSPHIRISGNVEQQKLAGEILLHDALYSQEFDPLETIMGMVSTKTRSIALAPPETESENGQLFLDLFINASKIKDKNKLADLNLGANLHVQGTTTKPQLAGRVELSQGTLVWGDIQYEILSGVLDFLDPLRINPEMNIQVETVVQEYEITLGIEGNLDQVLLNMTSNPPLSDGEITQLLAAGSSSGASGAFLLNPLQTMVEGRIEKAVKLDRFTVDVDPLLSKSGDSDATPRVTLGKRLFKDLLLTFTTSVGGTEKSQIVEIEYELSENMSLVAKRNEKGEVDASFTFKLKIK